MSKTYDLLANSFNELIDDYKENDGKNLSHITITLNLTPIKQYSGPEVRKIRMKNNLTQNLLASYLGVSKKTVEAWEAGKNHPTGPASRLLEMLDAKQIALVV